MYNEALYVSVYMLFNFTQFVNRLNTPKYRQKNNSLLYLYKLTSSELRFKSMTEHQTHPPIMLYRKLYTSERWVSLCDMCVSVSGVESIYVYSLIFHIWRLLQWHFSSSCVYLDEYKCRNIEKTSRQVRYTRRSYAGSTFYTWCTDFFGINSVKSLAHIARAILAHLPGRVIKTLHNITAKFIIF